MDAQTFTPEYLKGKRYGADTPSDLSQHLKWHWEHMTIEGQTFKGKIRVTLDTQEPRVEFTPFRNHRYGQIVFTAAKTKPFIQLFDQQGQSSGAHIAFFKQHESLKSKIDIDLVKSDLLVFEFKAHEKPPMPVSERETSDNDKERKTWDFLYGLPWTDEVVFLWLQFDVKLHEKLVRIKTSYTSAMNVVISEGSHWYINKVDFTPGKMRRPARPWLFKPDEKHGDQYGDISPRDAFFIDVADYQAHLLEGTRNDCHIQQSAIKDVFHIGVQHQCRFEKLAPYIWKVFVRISGQVKPVLSELTRVKFDQPQPDAVEKSLQYDGQIIDCKSTQKADFTILALCNMPEHFNGQEISMDLLMSANISPAQDQMKHLQEAWKVKVVGDRPDGSGKGFSLHTTLLAHGQEPFQLDMMHSDQLSAAEVNERIDMILDMAKLDEGQLEAFKSSTSQIPCGVQLIQGPPGTGKTKTAVSVILAHVCMGHKVLLAAGSNKAVDNLANAVFKAMKSNADLRKLVGNLVRFRTPAYCMSVIRNCSKNTNPIARVGELSSVEKALEECQVYTLVRKYAEKNPEEPNCKTFNHYTRLDLSEGLNGTSVSILKNSMEYIIGKILRLARTNIVASTLGSVAQELVRLNFQPDVLVCDESGQCLEAEHVIAMSLESMKAIILIGDPDQLPPTVMSGGDHNEYAGYLQRPLMTRLRDAGYPLALLQTNYRCHSQILKFFNQTVYNDRLKAGPWNDALERVGSIWDNFTATLTCFQQAKVVGLRRLVVNAPGDAEKEGTSSKNPAQVEVLAQILRELYGFNTASNDCITPADVLIISPYKAQRDCVKTILEGKNIAYRDNLTVDASQGQEAPIVFLLLTKPGPDSRQVGFVADRQRLNVALSRAQKVLVIIGNLTSWDAKAAGEMVKKPATRMLGKLLLDAQSRGHVLPWFGPEVVQMRCSIPQTPNTSGSAPPQQPAKRYRSRSPARRTVRTSALRPPQQPVCPDSSSRLPPRLPRLDLPPGLSQAGSSSSGHREVNMYRSRSPMRQEAPVPPGHSLGLPAPPSDLPPRPPPRERISEGLFSEEESITHRLRDLQIKMSRSVQLHEEARQAEIQARMDSLQDQLQQIQQIRRRSRSPETHKGP